MESNGVTCVFVRRPAGAQQKIPKERLLQKCLKNAGVCEQRAKTTATKVLWKKPNVCKKNKQKPGLQEIRAKALSQNVRDGIPWKHATSHQLSAQNGSRAAIAATIPSIRSRSIRLQNRFGILTGEKRRLGSGSTSMFPGLC